MYMRAAYNHVPFVFTSINFCPARFKSSLKKTFQFLEERGSICFNILQHKIQADGNFQFRPHICVYVNFFLALKFSYLYKHRIRHENQVSACKPSLGVWGVGLWDGNQIY